VQIPDLAENCFERLTITRQFDFLERLLAGQPAVLIGSSLGGYLAALYASLHPEIDRLILLAPAFNFYQLWLRELGPERLATWRQNGAMAVFHYGEGREMPLNFEFLEDAGRFDPFPSFAQPALLFHGDRDQVVPLQSSITFMEAHPNTRLVRLHSGHELTDVLDTIWLQSQPFLMESKLVLEC
jgi:pimeloyl-ACP methyl ester carboxylesterase